MNNYKPNIHHRKSIRLKGYDYSKSGLYFITICVKDRKCLFGNIMQENSVDPMVLNDAGKIVDECWLEIPKHFPNVVLHEHIIMPNHLHGIIELVKNDDVGVQNIDVGVQNFEPYYKNQLTNSKKSSRIPSDQLFGDIKLGLQNGLDPIRILNLSGNEIIMKTSSGQKYPIDV